MRRQKQRVIDDIMADNADMIGRLQEALKQVLND